MESEDFRKWATSVQEGIAFAQYLRQAHYICSYARDNPVEWMVNDLIQAEKPFGRDEMHLHKVPGSADVPEDLGNICDEFVVGQCNSVILNVLVLDGRSVIR